LQLKETLHHHHQNHHLYHHYLQHHHHDNYHHHHYYYHHRHRITITITITTQVGTDMSPKPRLPRRPSRAWDSTDDSHMALINAANERENLNQ
jgi:hypothetical protein